MRHEESGRILGCARFPASRERPAAIRGNPASPRIEKRFAHRWRQQVLLLLTKETGHPKLDVLFFGAGNEARTRYLHLGKVALYQMSYARENKMYFNKGFSSCQASFADFFIFPAGRDSRRTGYEEDLLEPADIFLSLSRSDRGRILAAGAPSDLCISSPPFCRLRQPRHPQAEPRPPAGKGRLPQAVSRPAVQAGLGGLFRYA